MAHIIQSNPLISLPEQFPKVEIKSQCDSTKVLVNGNEIEAIRKIKFEPSTDAVPHFEISTISRPNFEVLGKITFDYSVQTVEEALEILQHQIQNSTEFLSEMKGRFIRTLNRLEEKENSDKVLDEFILKFFNEEE